MLLNADYIEPAALTGYTRAALADFEVNQFRLAAWLPSENVDDLDYRYNRGGDGLIEAGTFRAFDVESPIAGRKGLKRVTGELPPLSRKIRLGEYDRLRRRAMERRQGADDPVVRQIENDGENMVRSLGARIELARGDAIFTASVTIAENDMYARVDFDRKPEHYRIAGTVWTLVDTATALSDELAAVEVYNDTNGRRPDVAMMPFSIRQLLTRNVEYRESVSRLGGTTPDRISLDDVDAIRRNNGLPPIVEYDAKVSVNGVATRITPGDSIAYLPAAGDPGNPETGPLGRTFWGTTSESLEPEYGLEGDEPGVVAGAYKVANPLAFWTNAAGIALPVLANPDLTLRLKVTA
jgi:hypothetical protein